jgi:hypothetical protein
MTPYTVNPQTSDMRVTDHGELSSRARRLLMERFDSSCAIEVLNRATDGDICVFGGTIRRALFHDKMSGDIDIMVPNGDDRAINKLDALKVPFVLNSNNHRRYRWNSLQIDIFQPREFFCGFEDVEKALCFFDLRINALSLHLRSGRILDPFHVVSQTPVTDPGINWTRWGETSPLNVVVLAIRLAKIMHEIPELTISTTDADRLLTEVVPRIRECDWMEVQERFPLGKQVFLQVFGTRVLDRTRAARPIAVPASLSHTRHAW